MAFFIVLIKASIEILIVNIKSDNENLSKIAEIKELLKRIKQGTSSKAFIMVCILMPPFFLPVSGLRPTPFKISLNRLNR